MQTQAFQAPLTRLWRALQIPLRNGLIAAFSVAALSLVLRDSYKSTAQILPADANASSMNAASAAAAASAMGISIPGGRETPDASFPDILNSRWMRKQVLGETYVFHTRFGLLGPRREHRETLYAYLKAKNMDRAVAKLKTMYSVSRDIKTKLITLTVETPSAELSQQVVQSMLRNLDDFSQNKSRTRGGYKAEYTAERLKEANAAYEDSTREFERWLSDHRNYQTSNDPLVRIRGAQLEAAMKLRQQVVVTLMLNHEQALLEQKNDIPILNVLDPGDVPAEHSSPSRSLLVILALILGAGGTWAVQTKVWRRLPTQW